MTDSLKIADSTHFRQQCLFAIRSWASVARSLCYSWATCSLRGPESNSGWNCIWSYRTGGSQGRSDGGVYRYIYPPKISHWKLFCALISADDVRLLVYSTVVLCSKNLYPPKTNFWLRPWRQ